MDISAVQSLMQLMEASALSEMEVEQSGLRVRMCKNTASAVVSAQTPPTLTALPLPPPLSAAPAAGPVPSAGKADGAPLSGPDTREITSPMVGTFHDLPDGKAVKIGQRVKKGQSVCIIEAMKLMNEIVADADGEILWIAVKEGQMVEYGQMLYQYR